MQLVHGRLNRPEKRNLHKCFDRHVNNVPPLEFTRVDVNSRPRRGDLRASTRGEYSRQCEIALTHVVTAVSLACQDGCCLRHPL